MIIEDKLEDTSMIAFGYSPTLVVVPLSVAVEIAKTYAYDMVEKYKQELLDKCMITSNNHEKDITESSIRETKIELI